MVRARIVTREQVAEPIVTLSLQVEGETPAWSPGAHIDLHLGNGMTRQYSLCGPLDEKCYRVAVLREPKSRGGSAWIHDELQEGSIIEVGEPRNSFPLVDAPDYLFIAGGIGVTPLVPMLEAATRAGRSWKLVYGGRSTSSMAFVDQLVLGYPDQVQIVDASVAGIINVPRVLDAVGESTKVYTCGPEPLIAAVEQGCADRGMLDRLHTERFAPAAEIDLAGDAVEVVCALSGMTVHVPSGVSILDALRDEGLDTPSSCEEGVCGSCETIVLQGEPDHRDSVLSPVDRASNACMMICVSRAKSPRLVLAV